MENTNLTLEEHRNRTIGEILGKLQNNDRVCCVRYTGYGKTYHLIKRLMEIFSDKQFLIFVPAKSLIKRYVKLFKENNVIIKTYQSLLFMNENEIKDNFSNIDYIICDEAHRLGKNKWRQSIKNAFDIIDNGNTKIIGFTATPMRGDKIDIVGDFFNGIETSRFDLLDGIQAGYIPKIDYVVAYCDLSGLDKEIYDERMEDIDRYEIDKLLNVSEIIKENIPKNKLKENLKVVLYVSRLKDVDIAKESCYKWFTEAFPNKNIKVFSLSSEYTDKENSDYLDDYSDDEDNNSIDIMISCNKLNEGLHLPKCSIAILLRRTTSPIVYFQQIGRAINGSKPVVFDLVNNSTHIKQIENDFKQGNQENLDLSIQSNKSKKIFSECVNLISKTKDIESILNRFKNKYTLLSDDEIKSICDLYKNGTLLKDIVGVTGRSHSHICFIINKYCSDYRRSNKKIDTEKIIELYKSGESIESIARTLHHHTQTVRDAIPTDLLRVDLKGYNRQKLVKEVCNLYDSGMSIRGIIKKTKRSGQTIREILKKNSDKYVFQPRKTISKNKELKVCELYNNGYSKNRIHLELNINQRAINRILKDYNVPKRKFISQRHYKVKVTKKKQEQICKLYKEIQSFKKVAKQLKMSDKIVYRVLKENNVEIVPVKDRPKKNYIPPYTQSQINKVVSTYKKVGTKSETARKVGLNVKTVKRILDYKGIK